MARLSTYFLNLSPVNAKLTLLSYVHASPQTSAFCQITLDIVCRSYGDWRLFTMKDWVGSWIDLRYSVGNYEMLAARCQDENEVIANQDEPPATTRPAHAARSSSSSVTISSQAHLISTAATLWGLRNVRSVESWGRNSDDRAGTWCSSYY